MLRSSLARVVAGRLEARCSIKEPGTFHMVHKRLSGFSFGPVTQLRYSTGNSDTSNTPRVKDTPGDLNDLLTPEEVATAAGFESTLRAMEYVNELIEQRSAAIKERSRKEAVFHPGDVLARRYELIDKGNQSLSESLRALEERKSWRTLWTADDLNTTEEVIVEVNEAGDQDNYTAAVRSAAVRALAGQHPNILRLLDVCEHRTHKGRHAVVVTEQAGSTLSQVRSRFGGRDYHQMALSLSEMMTSKICLASRMDGIRALKSIARQLFTALDHLHKRGIIHMFVHGSNIFLDKPFEARSFDVAYHLPLMKPLLDRELLVDIGSSTGPDTYHEGNLHTATIKLTGFSRAVFCNPLAAASDGLWSFKVPRDRDGKPLKTFLQLRAPEEILGLNYSAPSYDIWQAGLTLFYLATARELFEIQRWNAYKELRPHMLEAYGDDDLHMFDMIDTLGTLPRELIRRSPRFDELYLPSDNLKISRVLTVKPAKHAVSKLVQMMTDWKIPLGEAEALHQFITCILRPDPAKRPTASDILKHPWLQDTHAQRSPG